MRTVGGFKFPAEASCKPRSAQPVDNPEFSWFADGPSLYSLLLSCADAMLLPLPACTWNTSGTPTSNKLPQMSKWSMPTAGRMMLTAKSSQTPKVWEKAHRPHHVARTFKVLTGPLQRLGKPTRHTGGSQRAAAAARGCGRSGGTPGGRPSIRG